MKKCLTRSLCLLLVSLLLLSTAPGAAAYEIGEPWKIDLAEMIDNVQYRRNAEMLLDYYLRNDPAVQKTLEEGLTALFVFEGCSDNMDDPELSDLTYYRVTAVCVALKLDKDGEPYMIYFNENCSTIPDRPLEYGAWNIEDVGEVGPATICDGTYEVYSVKHNGAYEALHIRDSYDDGSISSVYMFCEGYTLYDATEINIHTRTSNHTSGRGMWSAGCILIGDGDFGQFTELMESTYYTVYDSFDLDAKVGTITINRQFLRQELYELYDSTYAIDTLLEGSDQTFPENYLEQCTDAESYDQPQPMRVKRDTELMTLPCTNEKDARSVSLGTVTRDEELIITGILTDPEGNTWYEAAWNGETAYIDSDDAEAIPKQKNFFERLWDVLFG